MRCPNCNHIGGVVVKAHLESHWMRVDENGDTTGEEHGDPGIFELDGYGNEYCCPYCMYKTNNIENFHEPEKSCWGIVCPECGGYTIVRAFIMEGECTFDDIDGESGEIFGEPEKVYTGEYYCKDCNFHSPNYKTFVK